MRKLEDMERQFQEDAMHYALVKRRYPENYEAISRQYQVAEKSLLWFVVNLYRDAREINLFTDASPSDPFDSYITWIGENMLEKKEDAIAIRFSFPTFPPDG